jgi:hypothetical protein
MLNGALVPRRSTTAGVPGPRRNADECDAGWFAPVATRRRSTLRAFWALAGGSQCFPGGIPWVLRLGSYSVFRNSRIATMSIPRPMAATMPSDSHTGTGQPTHVIPGASMCTAAGLRFRWLNTACRIGSTM